MAYSPPTISEIDRMAAPAIALRFRDSTPGIDTIAEHREMIARGGRVGWGWWKKTFEPDETEKIQALLANTPEIGIVLIDRTAERAYLCACMGFTKPNAADAMIVPRYYRALRANDHETSESEEFSLGA